MPDESRNKIKLNVRVTPSKKEEWRGALEDGETLSSLVQRAVDKEIRNEYVPIEAVEAVEATEPQDTSYETDTLEAIEELQTTVNALNSKIDTIAANDGGDEESIEDLAIDILPRLPQYPGDVPLYAVETLPESPTETIEVLIEARKSTEINIDGSAQRFATELREPEHRVRQALLYLERDTTENVHSAISDGIRHWMRF